MFDPFAANLKTQRLQHKLDFWRGLSIWLAGLLFVVLCFVVSQGWF